ncbi:HAD family hydrolase [Chryseosolibacter indicus]|uniref:HAD hydrolase-like protein n=1 Tax=Chryseosolibacter indicus TaxID=2782351 RepID=A0ABS5VRC1_9BACT|nr:HAD family hydrolase [Chryseosolibacter indicus]MBT1703982.1 HAD hydrolase-like protein [Chryseosolibacter indicus]
MAIKIVAFDADDTLWDNEAYFQETEQKFCQLLEDYLPIHTLSRELLQTEVTNLSLYGYGIKGFMLSMIETALRVTDKTIPPEAIEKILQFGKELLAKPVTIIDGVEQVLSELKNRYRLVMATKGDLLDQHRKLHKSGLGHYFHHIEIMTEKGEEDYKKLIKRLDIKAEEFVMIGNSLKSDVLPVLHIGGHGIHIPYHTTWAHEKIEVNIDHPNFRQVSSIREVTQYL